MSGIAVARLEDLPAGQLRRVDVNGTGVVLVRIGDAVYACGDTCAHRGGPLAEGKLAGHRLHCPWHGWVYDVRSGECLFPGRGARVPAYPVRIEDGDIRLEVP